MAWNSGRGFLKNLIIVIFVLVGLAGIIAGVWYFTNGFGGRVSAFGVKYGDNTYFTPTNGITIASGAEFELVNPLGGEYELTIIASSEKTDFGLKVGAEPYRWRDMNGKDFTDGFTVTKTETGFKLEYGSFADILSAVLGHSIELTETVSGDLFKLNITGYGCTLQLGFGIGEVTGNKFVEGVSFDKNHIVF